MKNYPQCMTYSDCNSAEKWSYTAKLTCYIFIVILLPLHATSSSATLNVPSFGKDMVYLPKGQVSLITCEVFTDSPLFPMEAKSSSSNNIHSTIIQPSTYPVHIFSVSIKLIKIKLTKIKLTKMLK